MEREIILSFNRKDFEDIVMAGPDWNYFKNTRIRKSLIYTILFLIAFIFLIILERFGNVHLIFYMWAVPLFLFFLISTINTGYRIYKYKRSIKKWMDYTSKFKTHKVEVSDHSIAVIMDKEKTIQTWSSINYASINDLRILLNGTDQFYIPAKSMSEEEYIFLRETVESKLKSDVL